MTAVLHEEATEPLLDDRNASHHCECPPSTPALHATQKKLRRQWHLLSAEHPATAVMAGPNRRAIFSRTTPYGRRVTRTAGRPPVKPLWSVATTRFDHTSSAKNRDPAVCELRTPATIRSVSGVSSCCCSTQHRCSSIGTIRFSCEVPLRRAHRRREMWTHPKNLRNTTRPNECDPALRQPARAAVRWSADSLICSSVDCHCATAEFRDELSERSKIRLLHLDGVLHILRMGLDELLICGPQGFGEAGRS